MAISLYDLRTLLEVVRVMPRTKTFLRDNFFTNVKTFPTKTVDIDIVDSNNNKMAAFVNRRSGGSYALADGFETMTYEPACINELMTISFDEIQSRMPGENVYASLNPAQREQKLLAERLRQLDRRITIREEWMAAQALFTGKIDIKGDGVSDTLTFWNQSDKPYTEIVTKWSEESANPLDDLEVAVAKLEEKSGYTATRVIMGAKAYQAFLARYVKNGYFDTKYIQVGSINPTLNKQQGSRFVGVLNATGLELYTYNGRYTDPTDGQSKPFVPDDLVLIAGDNAPTTRAYGLIQIVDNSNNIVYAETDRAANSYVQRTTPAGRVVQMLSNPLFIVNVPHAFHVLKVVD